MTDFTFRELSVEEAEEMLVARCITDKTALQLALDVLPLKPFRSAKASDLHAVFYALAGWLAKGTYERETNEPRLAAALARRDEKDGRFWDALGWSSYLDYIWSPWTAVPEYFCALLEALTSAYRLQDAEFAAVRTHLDGNPFMPDEGFEDALYLRLQAAIIRRRKARHAPQTPAAPPSPVPDWKDLEKRVQK